MADSLDFSQPMQKNQGVEALEFDAPVPGQSWADDQGKWPWDRPARISDPKEAVKYVIEHKYEPDFVRKIGRKKILLESKGRFWDFAEYNKYVWVKKNLPKNTELVFLFANPSAPMPGAKRRKDGTKRSHAEWANANGFRWFSEDTIPNEWIDADARDTEEFKKRNDKINLEMQ